MQNNKPILLKGMRDFDALQVFRRNYIINTIRQVYHKYGALPIETPALEHLDTLTGKYGEEGEQLVFRVLNFRRGEKIARFFLLFFVEFLPIS